MGNFGCYANLFSVGTVRSKDRNGRLAATRPPSSGVARGIQATRLKIWFDLAPSGAFSNSLVE